MDRTVIEQVMVGRRAPLTPDGEESAIRKAPVDGPVAATAAGLAGDEHASHGHGGPDKVILHCAAEHYDTYRRHYAGFLADLAGPRRGFGENVTTRGMTEEDVCLGDRYRIGTEADGVVGEVTGFRQPCWKLGYNSGVKEIPKVMQDEGSAGWYYRVIAPGRIAAGDVFTLLERPYPQWTIGRLTRAFYGTPLDREFLHEVRAIPVLGEELQRVIDARLETGRVEPWESRLYGA
ncbi:MAG: MOSC domain-containing protein [Spirochaeta sp.]|jgi:MOSC domain-containing protein YiiM|nr:MOSC domain-containing protein [Spirochaeta sp.]